MTLTIVSTIYVHSTTALNAVVMDKRTMDIPTTVPTDYVAYRVTSDNDNLVFDLFKGMPCVIARELSEKAVKHFHVVVEGHVHYELVQKRLQRAKLGRAKYWSKKNHMDDFLKAISYTVKCGDYYTRQGFHRWVEIAPDWIPKEEFLRANEEAEAKLRDGKDLSKHWMFTYSNILKVAFNYRKRNELSTDKLGDVLAHMSREDKWIPSPQMVKNGLDPWFHRQFEWMCSAKMAPPPAWWEPHVN